MKKVILLTLWNLALSAPMFYMLSCGPSKEEMERQQNQLKTVDNYDIITIDRCEYIRLSTAHGEVITHKGNCKNKSQH